MRQIITLLRRLGLSRTEAELYLAGVKRPVSVARLIKRTGHKPSTVYHALSTLKNKGIAMATRDAEATLVSMVEPVHLSRLLSDRRRELRLLEDSYEELLPLFPRLSGREPEARISHYHSIAGIKSVIDQALATESRRWRIIAPRDNFLSQYDRDYAEYFIREREIRQIRARTLWERPTDGRKPRLSIEQALYRRPHYLPDSLQHQFGSIVIIFDDSMAIIAPLAEQRAILIENAATVDTFKVMFDTLYELTAG